MKKLLFLPIILTSLSPVLAQEKPQAKIYDVAIVGAGISGLYCGWQLAKKKEKVIILEQGNRVGGRIWSVKIPKITTFDAEVGAMRFLPSHTLLVKLLKELKLPLHDFHFGYPQNPVFVRNTHFKGTDFTNKKATIPYKLSKKYRGKTADQIIADVIEEYIPGALKKTPEQWEQIKKTHLIEEQPLYAHGFWALMLKKISMEDYHYIQDTGGFNTIISNWNAAEAFAWFAQDFQPGQKYHTLKPGMSLLPEKLAEEFKKAHGMIKLESSIETIAVPAKKKHPHLELTTKGNETINAHKVILALPKRAIELIQEKSPLLQTKQLSNDLASVDAEKASKIFIAYDAPWWTKLNLTYGHALTDLPLRQCFYFGTQKPLTVKKNNPSLVMAGYNDGRAVEFWNGFTKPSDPILDAPSGLINEVQRQLEKIHQTKIPQPYFALFHDWADDPFGGGWHFWNPQVKTWEVMPRIQQPLADIPLYICGEAYSLHQGWIEGALETAENLLKDKFKL